MTRREDFSSWVEVDLGQIAKNVAWFTRLSDAKVMAVVKANGYGHGAIQVAKAALFGGATWLGVARVEEALELRGANLDCPILVLGYTPPLQYDLAIGNNVAMAVWSLEQIEQISARAQSMGGKARLHLKIDTGMSRLGVQAEKVNEISRLLTKTPGTIFEGLFTHFARADEVKEESNENQERKFQEVVDGLKEKGDLPRWVHACNSAATLTRPNSRYNLVRTGLAIYGLQPSTEFILPEEVKPALSWKSVLSHVKVLPAGRGVSYGHAYRTSGEELIGTAPVGYADGLRRVEGNQVLVNGCRVPVVGRVCMDQILLNLDRAPKARVGDEIVLIGPQGVESISSEEVAKRWNTINYEVVCGIGARVQRVYI